MSDSFQPHGPQHARLPCPSSSSRACSNSCPLSWWRHLTISSSVVPFSCLQYFQVSGSFLMNWLFASGDQSTGASVSASVLPMNIQGWFPVGWTGLISLCLNLIMSWDDFDFGSNLNNFLILPPVVQKSTLEGRVREVKWNTHCLLHPSLPSPFQINSEEREGEREARQESLSHTTRRHPVCTSPWSTAWGLSPVTWWGCLWPARQWQGHYSVYWEAPVKHPQLLWALVCPSVKWEFLLSIFRELWELK